MVMLIIIATVPLFVMVFLQDAVNQLFSNSIMVSCALLATGFILFSPTAWPGATRPPKTRRWRTP